MSYPLYAFVSHSYSEHLSGIELNNTCVTEFTIQSINSVKVCSQLKPLVMNKGTDHEYVVWNCGQYQSKKIILPRTLEQQQCQSWSAVGSAETDPNLKCIRYKNVAVSLPKTILTRKDVVSGEYNQSIFQNYTFPDCN